MTLRPPMLPQTAELDLFKALADEKVNAYHQQTAGVLTERMKRNLIFDYVCSVCWSPLVEDGAPGPIVCTANPAHSGYVTRQYAERRRQQSQYDLQTVKAIYQESDIAEQLGLAAPRKSREQLLAEFNQRRAQRAEQDRGL